MEDQPALDPVSLGAPEPPTLEELELEHVFDENRELYLGDHGFVYMRDRTNPAYDILGRIYGYATIRVGVLGVHFQCDTCSVNGLSYSDSPDADDMDDLWYDREIQVTYGEALKIFEYLPSDYDYEVFIPGENPEDKLEEIKSKNKDLARLQRYLERSRRPEPRCYDESWYRQTTELARVGPKGGDETRGEGGRLLEDGYELLVDQDGRFSIIGVDHGNEDQHLVDATRPFEIGPEGVRIYVYDFVGIEDDDAKPKQVEISFLAAARFYSHLKFKAKLTRDILAIAVLLAKLAENNGIVREE